MSIEARKLIGMKQLQRIVPLSRTTILKLEKKGQFPQARLLSWNRKVWFEDEVRAWVENAPPGRAGNSVRKKIRNSWS